MLEPTAHAARVADILSRLDETSGRFAARLEKAGSRGEQASEGWTPAQIGVHVALVNQSLASIIDGSGAGALPPADGFVEQSWPEIVSRLPARNESPSRFVPPTSASIGEAVSQLRSSTVRLREALTSLTPERSLHCFTHRLAGPMTLYQVGDFAIAHMIRHNNQAKRTLGE